MLAVCDGFLVILPTPPAIEFPRGLAGRSSSTVLLDGFTRRFYWTFFTPSGLPWLGSAGAAAAAAGSGWGARSVRRRRAGTPGRSPGRTEHPFLLPARASHG